jgi:hypothetical protein
MASKKPDYSTASRGLLGLDKPAVAPNKDTSAAAAPSTPAVEPVPEEKQALPAPVTAKPAAEVAPAVKSEAEKEKPAQPAAGQGRAKKVKEATVKTSVNLSEENNRFIMDIKTIEGSNFTDVLNSLLDEVRQSKRAALDKAMEMHKQGRKAWQDL